jgi:hypothetical protein
MTGSVIVNVVTVVVRSNLINTVTVTILTITEPVIIFIRDAN